MGRKNLLHFIQKKGPFVHEPVDLLFAIAYFGLQNLEVMPDMKRCFFFFTGLVLSILCFVILESQNQPALDSQDDEMISDPVVSSASEFQAKNAPDLNLDKSL